MRFLMFFIAILIAGTAHTAEPSGILKCSAITDGVKRLECFDNLASSDQAEANKQASEDLGGQTTSDNWHTTINQSKIDDTTTVILLTPSKDEVQGRFNRTATPVLILRCLENTTSAFINFDGLFMADSGGYGRVTFRVDKTKAVTRSFSASTNHKALGLWGGGQAIPFIQNLMDGSALIVQATPHSESPVTMEFDISGLKEAIQPLRKACNW